MLIGTFTYHLGQFVVIAREQRHVGPGAGVDGMLRGTHRPPRYAFLVLQ
jgi:hypothetical protein